MIRRPVMTLQIAVIAALFAVLAVMRLRPDTSLASLFNQNDPAAEALVRVLDNFRSAEELLVLASSPSDGPEPQKLLAFAERLEAAVHADPKAAALCDSVVYRVDPEIRAFMEQVLVPNGLFYLDDVSFQAAMRRLTRVEMTRQIRRNEALIATPGPAADALAKVLLKDPLHLHEFLLERVGASRPFQTYRNSDAFISADGRSLLIRVRGKRPVSDLEFSNRFTASIQTLAARANTDGLELNISGAYAIAAASQRAIRRDMICSIISSVICLQLLFIAFYRRPFRSFVLTFAPVAAGTLYGFGVYGLLSRRVSPMTAAIGGILAGMSIDYAIQFISFYHARRSAATTPFESALAARRDIGSAMVAAWATSIVGFIAIGSSHVRALRDFSLLGCFGLTGAFLAAMFVLPALLVVVDSAFPFSAGSILRFPVDKLLWLVSRHRRVSLTMGTILFGGCVLTLLVPGAILPLESDLSVMHPRPNPALDAQAIIARRMGTSAGTMIVHLNASSPAELLALAHAVDSRLRDDHARAAGVTGTFGLATVLPDPAVAPTRLATAGEALADRVVADFRAAVGDSLFQPAAYEPYAAFLRTLLTPTRPPHVHDLLRYRGLCETILPADSLAADASPTQAITLVFIRDPNQERETRNAAVLAIRAALAGVPGATLTGLSVLSFDAESNIRRELPRLIVIALAVVALYLTIYFRNVKHCLLAMLPTAFSFACLLAFMRLSGQRLNMINLVAFPLLIGIDVDYGIFLVSAARRGATIAQLAPGAHAVLLCALTTILGFGSLAFTSVPAVQSLGVAVGVGVGACLIATFILLVPMLLNPSRARDGAE